MNIERWHTLTLAEQLGNIGSEIHRIRVWKDRGDRTSTMQAFDRALECIDLSLADDRWKHRLKEIARLREVLTDRVLDAGQYSVPFVQLEDYCMFFAMIARSQI